MTGFNMGTEKEPTVIKGRDRRKERLKVVHEPTLQITPMQPETGGDSEDKGGSQVLSKPPSRQSGKEGGKSKIKHLSLLTFFPMVTTPWRAQSLASPMVSTARSGLRLHEGEQRAKRREPKETRKLSMTDWGVDGSQIGKEEELGSKDTNSEGKEPRGSSVRNSGQSKKPRKEERNILPTDIGGSTTDRKIGVSRGSEKIGITKGGNHESQSRECEHRTKTRKRRINREDSSPEQSAQSRCPTLLRPEGQEEEIKEKERWTATEDLRFQLGDTPQGGRTGKKAGRRRGTRRTSTRTKETGTSSPPKTEGVRKRKRGVWEDTSNEMYIEEGMRPRKKTFVDRDKDDIV